MSEAAIESASGKTVRDSFFFWMSALVVFFAFGGFTPTYFSPMVGGTLREVSPAVHIHGALFFFWTLLLLSQTGLIARRNVSAHRGFGMLGISLATAMVIFGVIVNLQANMLRISGDEVERGYVLGFFGTSAVVAFGVMFGLAIKNIHRPDHHKRWMLLATAALLNAPLVRLFSPLFGSVDAVPFVLNVAAYAIIPVACLVYDKRVVGHLHLVTLLGCAILVSRIALTATITGTQTWRSIYDGLLTLL
jgi:hypothetical protein